MIYVAMKRVIFSLSLVSSDGEVLLFRVDSTRMTLLISSPGYKF